MSVTARKRVEKRVFARGLRENLVADLLNELIPLAQSRGIELLPSVSKKTPRQLALAEPSYNLYARKETKVRAIQGIA